MAATRLLILDMDNTLYDWRSHFCAVFEPLVAAVSDLIAESTPVLKRQFRAIHQSEGHMECAAVVRRLPSVAGWMQRAPARGSEIDRLVDRLVELGRSNLQPYPGVRQALTATAQEGWGIVVFTESPAAVAAERLHAMNLIDLVEVVYGAQGFLGTAPPPRIRSVPLPPFMKPASDILRGILQRATTRAPDRPSMWVIA
jgi:FMN phosphatase YigB (HAD superfamily)